MLSSTVKEYSEFQFSLEAKAGHIIFPYKLILNDVMDVDVFISCTMHSLTCFARNLAQIFD